MKKWLSQHPAREAFTLVEVMVGSAVSITILGALLTGTIALQRSYQASEYYAEASGDQVRALDYIVRDTRGALTVQVSTDLKTLTLTLPAYYSSYDAQGNPNGAPVTPTISNNVVTYGNSATPITIAYFVSGNSLIRQVTIGSTNTTSQSVIANNVDNFAFTFGAVDSTITASISFSPRFRGVADTTDTRTTRSATIYMRNHK